MSNVLVILAIFAVGALASVEIETEFDPVMIFMPEPNGTFDGGSERIINGFTAVPHAYPYQVGIEILVSAGWTWCGGALISPYYILLAAHCVDQAIYVNVIFGAHDRLNSAEAGQFRMYVDRAYFIVHTGWDPYALANDIALIRLPSPVTYTSHIQPVALPTRALSYTNFEASPAVSTGWGYIKQTSGLSQFLNYADVTILNQATCGSYLRQVRSTNICVDGSYGRGACYGDSGSPLVSTAGAKYIIGITSFVSSNGCEINYPTVYTRVTSYLDWIASYTGLTIR